MAEGDRFYLNGQYVAEQRGYKFESGGTQNNAYEVVVSNTYHTIMRPELFLVELEGLTVVKADSSKPGHRTIYGPILPRRGSALQSKLPNGTVVVMPTIRLDTARITNIEVLNDGWLVESQLRFGAPNFSNAYNQTGLHPAYVSQLSFSSVTEERTIDRFNVDLGGGQVALNQPAVNSAGSPIEMTYGVRQVLMSCKFNRTADGIFDPVAINNDLVGSVNDDLFPFAGKTFSPCCLRLERYDATVVPMYDVDDSIPNGYYYEIDAQVLFDYNTFFRPLLDVGLMFILKNAPEFPPHHIWQYEEEVDGVTLMRFGSKAVAKKFTTNPDSVEQITSPVLLNGNGFPSSVITDTSSSFYGMQEPYYRYIMIEPLWTWPICGWGHPTGPEGLLPAGILEWSW